MASGVIKQPTTALSFTVTLGDSWSNNSQTITNSNFIASGYTYLVSPDKDSRAAYIQADVYAENVTSNNYMKFNCTAPPSGQLVVNIVRLVTT